jgi:hypothetical protein
LLFAMAMAQPVPPILLPVNGQFLLPSGLPRTGPVRVRVAIYEHEVGGEPVWFEDQDITLDANGGYTVTFGAVTKDGVPPEVFASGAARWMGGTPEGEPDGLRALMRIVPYAAKAARADALAGASADNYVRTDQVLAKVMAALPVPVGPLCFSPPWPKGVEE